eukprot:5910225-Pleurochrysis_carterae.AAC.1
MARKAWFDLCAKPVADPLAQRPPRHAKDPCSSSGCEKNAKSATDRTRTRRREAEVAGQWC